MRLLLDTHAFIWWRENNPTLVRRAREAIGGASTVFVSVASAWEIAIKQSLGRFRLDGDVEAGILDSGFERLSIAFSHAAAVASLPDRHRDPFDRMLIAQALAERLTIVTRDRNFAAYGVDIIPA
jgi:PIN domain nuclease of toxin-antitoxin system